MCRWLAYTGNALQASAVILDAQHSLVAQSLNSPLGQETVNGDGFGFGWYPENTTPGTEPAFFHSIEPAWNDQNLAELTRSVHSPLFFSHVRAAAGPPIQQTNCHPFRYQNWMFMHNGFLADFGALKRDLTLGVDPSLYPHILGTTDSEVLFYLALTLGLQDDPIAAMGAMIRTVESVGRDHGVQFAMQGTIAVTDGVTVWAFRYSSQGRTRTLFHSADVDTLREMYPDVERLKLFGSTAHLIVSEPLNDLPGVFIEVPEATVAIVDASGYHHMPFLSVDA